MNTLDLAEKLPDIINTLSLYLVEGTTESIFIDDYEISLNRKDGIINLTIDTNKADKNFEEDFDDTDIKDIVSEFRDSINNLDDCIFLQALERAEKAIDIQRFDELLNLEKYSEVEATEVACLIDYFSQIISTVLQEKIQELVGMSNKF